LRCDATAVGDADGNRVGYLLLLADVTPQHQYLRHIEHQHHLLGAVFEAIRDPLLLTDAEQRVLLANRAVERVFGQPPEAVVGQPVQHLFADAAACEARLDAPELAVPAEMPVLWARRADGELFPTEVGVSVVPGGDARLGRAVLVRDITESKRAAESEQWARAVFENTAEGIMLTDADNRIVAVNPAFTAITGYRAEEVLGRSPSLLRSGRQNKDFYRAMWRELEAGGRWKGELWNRRKDGEIYAEWLSISEIRDADGTLRHRVGVFSDITPMRRSEEEIDHLTHYDPITGLPNQRLLRARLEQALQSAQVANRPLALMLLNLDGFKRVVASFGHEVADAALQRAKSEAPGSIAFYRPELTAAALRVIELDRTMRTALASNQFELHFQPKLDLGCRCIVGAEALLRWRRPDGVLVPPHLFMEAVEKSDLMLDVDRWVLLVGDDEVELGRIATQLAELGCSALRAAGLSAALDLVQQEAVDLVLGDAELPDGDAVDLLAALRRSHPTITRMLLAAQPDTAGLVEAINRGGIFRCLPKPLSDEDLAQAMDAGYAHGLRKLRQQPSAADAVS
jgi:PAS domain S-box-containing protein